MIKWQYIPIRTPLLLPSMCDIRRLSHRHRLHLLRLVNEILPCLPPYLYRRFALLKHRVQAMSKTQPQPSNQLETPVLRRECFVTVGATASFRSLLDQALSIPFVFRLSELKYTHLTIQCGPDLEYARSRAQDTGPGASQNERKLMGELMGVKWKLFDFNKLGLGAEMRGCKGLNKGEREGVVVCHSGRFLVFFVCGSLFAQFEIEYGDEAMLIIR
jgi:hypothetical protein